MEAKERGVIKNIFGKEEVILTCSQSRRSMKETNKNSCLYTYPLSVKRRRCSCETISLEGGE